MLRNVARLDATVEQLAVLVPMIQATSEPLGGGENSAQEGGNRDDEVVGGSADNVSTIAERKSAKRLVAQWNKDQSRRYFSLSLTMSLLSGDGGKARPQELVGDALLGTESVFKMLNDLSSMRVRSFGPRQIEVGGVKGRQSEEVLRRLL